MKLEDQPLGQRCPSAGTGNSIEILGPRGLPKEKREKEGEGGGGRKMRDGD
jgi:hypothetical protein